MNCCSNEHTQAKDNFFSKRSKRYAKQFRKKGLDKPQQLLLEGILKANTISSKSLLEIGCGAGGLLITLLQKGASNAIGVDASEGMLEHAKQFAKDLKQENRIEFRYGDFSQQANAISQADVTILDKVLCCDENPKSLIELSTQKTNEVYAVSFPRDGIMARIFFTSGIAIAKLFRLKFTPFYHEASQLELWIESNGFLKVYSNNTIIWQILIFKKK